MAVPKDKVLAAIEAKFKGASLTKNFKESIAAKMADKIETEADIDAYIDDRADFFTETQSEADRRASEAVKKRNQDEADRLAGKNPKDPASPAPVEPTGNPQMDKMLEMMQALTSEVTTLKTERANQTIADRFSKDERLKGIDPLFYKGRVPTSEEELETRITEITTDYNAFAAANKMTVLGKDIPGKQGQQAPAGQVAEPSKEQVDAVLAKI